MSWQNVRLIWFREVRDQLRDRRTIFMIAVLPVPSSCSNSRREFGSWGRRR